MGVDVTNASGKLGTSDKAEVLGAFSNEDYMTKMYDILFKFICSGSEVNAQFKASF